MRKITLDKPWSYVTPEKTIDYPKGKHEVHNYIADKAEADGATPKEEANGGADKPAAAGPASAADAG